MSVCIQMYVYNVYTERKFYENRESFERKAKNLASTRPIISVHSMKSSKTNRIVVGIRVQLASPVALIKSLLHHTGTK